MSSKTSEPFPENIEETDLLSDARVHELFVQGAREGQLTYSAINDLLSDLQLDEDALEILFGALEARDIAIVEEKSPAAKAAKKTSRPARHEDLDDVLSSLQDLESLLVSSGLPAHESGNRDESRAEDKIEKTEDGEDIVSDEEGIEDAFKQYLNRMGQIPLLSTSEEMRLGIQAREGSEEEQISAKQKLVEANLRLVVSIAKTTAAARPCR